ncbi:MAG: nucleoside deaminase [Candidatus Dadabacteria bacterium]|nr:nucleoside deaminase [Candidatus Dadabacteria bacterium]NIS09364.1 nucleoside deaminase [Candidatus Dadabacteria bacterium]NIX15900.1 tRNA-specific adenosine deaminase [Candidatus Dadabacteria bacterium]NIY22607.1 tRNA-specific adenosine deaminase [Candidatus Dadabacteria bacterium]
MKNDQYFMSLALQEAKKAKSVGEVPVGCIIADSDGKIASKGHNLCEKQNDPTAHAEIVAIRKLSKKTQSWRLEGKSIYCTLQPCLMCMGAIVNSRIERLVYGTDDPRLLEINYIYELEDIYPPVKKLQITKNILKEDCALMLKEFFSTLRT